MSAPRVVVVGAGISGLAAAHKLVELAKRDGAELDLRVLEASDRAGGVLQTTRRDGFLLEHGPDSFITEKPWGIDLCRRLGLEGELTGTNPKAQRSFVVRDGRLLPVPPGFYLLAPTQIWPFVTTRIFSWPGKLRMAAELFLPVKSSPDETLASFVRRRFGREALERMAQPMVAGIYAADPESLSLRATFPRFLELEAKYGSVLRGMWSARRATARGTSGPRYGLFATLKGGMDGLVRRLIERLPAGAVKTGAGVRSISRNDAGYSVALADGGALEADAVCVALGAPAAARLLHGLDPALATELAGIVYRPSATVHFAFDRRDVAHPMDGFGFVVPAIEGRAVLGCTFGHVKFAGRAPEGAALMRAFIGGPQHMARLAQPDDMLVEAVRRDVSDLLGIKGRPLFHQLSRHPQSLPEYALGHLDRVASIEAKVAGLPGFALAGNGTRGIGLPDCVHSGEGAAERIYSTVLARAAR